MGADPGLLPLLCWLSPSFPIGAYAYSHGLEWAAEAGDVRDEASLEAWLADVLEHGLGRNDAILMAAAHGAAGQPDLAALRDVNDLALALAASAEFRLETSQQGRSFLDAVAQAWPEPALARIAASFGEVALPVAVAAAARCHGIPADLTVKSYLTATMQNLVSAALRLAPIGQSAGQRIVARSVPRLTRLADQWASLDIDDVGSSTFRADLGSFRHETQYTRLFRS